MKSKYNYIKPIEHIYQDLHVHELSDRSGVIDYSDTGYWDPTYEVKPTDIVTLFVYV